MQLFFLVRYDHLKHTFVYYGILYFQKAQKRKRGPSNQEKDEAEEDVPRSLKRHKVLL